MNGQSAGGCKKVPEHSGEKRTVGIEGEERKMRLREGRRADVKALCDKPRSSNFVQQAVGTRA